MNIPSPSEQSGSCARGPSVLPLTAQDIVLERDGRTLLGKVSFSLGETSGITVLLGPNGAGKSLLARTLCGLLVADGGEVRWAGAFPGRMGAKRIGIVFQRPVLLARSIRDNILYALGATGVPSAQRAALADAALTQAGLHGLATQHAHSLSGGEKQRLALVRALACNPQVLILDEPCANLDPASTAAIEGTLRLASAGGIPILFITHDIAQARRLADHIVFMSKGQIVEQSNDAALFFSNPRTPESSAYVRGELLV